MVTKSDIHFTQIDRRTRINSANLVNAIFDQFVHSFHPRKLILFGSQARGQVAEGSDIDLLVVLDSHHPLASLKRRDREGKLLDLFRYRSFGLDAFVLTEAEVQELQATNEGEWDLVLEILEEGKVLHDCATEA
jgi:predicted nucleotidyltransferase